jgi:nucleoside-diphosphate-sugar epimerase
MRYLITGGAGFIGSHLSEELLRRGHHVAVLDDLSTGAIENVRHLKERAGFTYVIDSAANVPLLAELVDEADVVYHLAAAVGVELIVDSPVQTIETNVHCTEILLAQANKKKKPVFLASTSEVYGKNPSVPFREDGDLLIVFVPYEEAYEEGFEDMDRRVPDTSKLRTLIGWEPKLGLEETLSDVVEYERAKSAVDDELTSAA